MPKKGKILMEGWGNLVKAIQKIFNKEAPSIIKNECSTDALKLATSELNLLIKANIHQAEAGIKSITEQYLLANPSTNKVVSDQAKTILGNLSKPGEPFSYIIQNHNNFLSTLNINNADELLGLQKNFKADLEITVAKTIIEYKTALELGKTIKSTLASLTSKNAYGSFHFDFITFNNIIEKLAPATRDKYVTALLTSIKMNLKNEGASLAEAALKKEIHPIVNLQKATTIINANTHFRDRFEYIHTILINLSNKDLISVDEYAKLKIEISNFSKEAIKKGFNNHYNMPNNTAQKMR